MKILFAGDFAFAWYEEACALALESLGHTVVRFSWLKYFHNFIGKVERHFVLPGPATIKLNRDLIRVAIDEKPDVILLWRGVYIWPETVARLKKQTGAILASYNNDDPFSPYYLRSRNMHLKRLWRYFRDTIPFYDLNFVVRTENIAEYLAIGAKHTYMLKHFFVPHIHRPLNLSAQDLAQYQTDVVFVGHYEDDGRLDHLRALINASIKVKLYGSGWPSEILGDLLEKLGPVRPVFLDDYTKALCGAKLCLSFVSKLNRDTYTSRTFEIPACRGVLVSERTSEIPQFYREDQEAIFFSSPNEMVAKAQQLLSNDAARLAIAEAGYQRCWTDGHDSVSRMREFLQQVNR